MTTLPKELAADLARVRTAIHAPMAGPDVIAARESLDRIEAALVASSGQQARFNALAVSVFTLGHAVRECVEAVDPARSVDDLLAAMCDAEELATVTPAAQDLRQKRKP